MGLVVIEEVHELGFVKELWMFGIDGLALHSDFVSVLDVDGEEDLTEGSRSQFFLDLISFSDSYAYHLLLVLNNV